jgi:hypothetical protein
MKPTPLAMPPGNMVLLIMVIGLALDVYRTFFQKVNDEAKGKG